MKKSVPILLFVLSIIFLIPGITLPLMTIKATVDKQEMLSLAVQLIFPPEQSNNFMQQMLHTIVQQVKLDGEVEVFESTRSLIGTMKQLLSHNHIMVGLLIGVFGVIIPVLKIVLILISLSHISLETQIKLMKISSSLSKWSMSDVFMMAILVAFLAINANEQSVKPVQMHAELGLGFYFFTSYCLMAIIANHYLLKLYKNSG